MSALKSFHLRAFAAILLTYLAFVVLMTDDLAIVARTATEIATLLLALAAALGVALGGLLVLSLDRRTRMDEREATIDMAAERAGYYALDAGVFALTGLVLINAGWGTLDLSRPEAQLMALVSLTTLGALARFAAAFWHERRL